MKLKYLLTMFISFLFISSVNASNEIYNMDINVYLDENGNANITETWDVKGESGTEWYKVMNNLGNSEITDFEVSMDWKKLTYKEWDVNESLTEKKGYYGINYTSDGEELCFGKYDYNRHRFILKYKLSNMVYNLEDSQVLYYNFIDKLSDVKFDKFSLKISSYYSFPDTLDVWGYGYKGYSYVENGVIKASTEENSDMNNKYVVQLVKFKKDTFKDVANHPNYKKFEEVEKAAKKGSFKYDYGENVESIIETIFEIIMPVLFIAIPVIIGVIANQNQYGYRDNKKIDKKNTSMFRDIPCNKDIHYANALLKLNAFDFNPSNIYGAYILKWVKEGKIIFIKDQKTGLFNKETSSLDLRSNPSFDTKHERIIYDYMLEASKDGILEAKELERWCRTNYKSFFKVFDNIVNDTISDLKSSGEIVKRSSKAECKRPYIMSDKIFKDSSELYGLKLFLQEFSRIDTREVMEVNIWDEYLMFAYLFGIADKVAKQLKNLYPEVLEQTEFDYDTVIFVNNITARGTNAASSARSAAENYSSGGGGFSSGGGGGGSFGGGGGGSR